LVLQPLLKLVVQFDYFLQFWSIFILRFQLFELLINVSFLEFMNSN
jgi:hypothetical protein